MKQKQRVLVKAPILTQSGYGEHGRFVLRALRSQENIFDIYLHALEWGHTSWHWEDTEERAWIDGLLQKTIHYLHSGGHFLCQTNDFEAVAVRNLSFYGVLGRGLWRW